MKSTDFPDLALMRAGVEYRFPIRLRQYEVMVRPLSNLEIIEATGQAAEAYERLEETKRTQITSTLLLAMYQLEKASSEDIGEPGRLTLALLQHMTNEEVNTLWKQYCRVCDRVNPAFEDIDAEKVIHLVEALKKNTDPLSLLIDMPISELIAVSLRLVRLIG